MIRTGSEGRLVLRVAVGLLLILLWPGLFRPGSISPAKAANPPPAPLDKEEIAFLLGDFGLGRGRPDLIRVSAGQGASFFIRTTIVPAYQEYLNRRLAKARAPMVSLVAMDPHTGRVKALISYDRLPGRTNYALTPTFPAASVFKMVTAAAALERGGLSPESKIPFHGGSHTLYRSQLKIPEPNAPRKPTLTESFARSFNPVFGKLANKPVGPRLLERFAYRFGFNQAIRFELPVSPSLVNIPQNDTFGIAAIGSGFNRITTLSPLHGAMMAAAVVNNGLMMEPSIVDRITVYNKKGRGSEVYRTKPRVMRRSLAPETAANMRRLMGATISRGTGRRTFRRAKYDRVLKDLLLGGKTGSINDASRRYRIDWFVGYGWNKKTGQALTVGVVVAHDLARRGIGSRFLARDAIRHYFDPTPNSKLKADVPDSSRSKARKKRPKRKRSKPKKRTASSAKGSSKK